MGADRPAIGSHERQVWSMKLDLALALGRELREVL